MDATQCGLLAVGALRSMTSSKACFATYIHTKNACNHSASPNAKGGDRYLVEALDRLHRGPIETRTFRSRASRELRLESRINSTISCVD
jgi:hypothetical protein